MHHARWLVIAGAATAATIPFAVPVSASTAHGVGDDSGTVFVQTNDPAGNGIVVFHRRADGTLVALATYFTGGDGGRATGSMSDPLASQGSVIYDADRGLLFTVNAGSDSISVFRVDGDVLWLRQVIGSGGSFPTSITVHDDRLYVLNAGGVANVAGFRITGDRLSRIDGATRTLGLSETTPPQFLMSPAQIGLTPDGKQLLVTGKTNNFIDVFSVDRNGSLDAPVQTADASVPFAFTFSPRGQLDLVNAAGSLVAADVRHDGAITFGTPVPNGQSAACWITTVDGYAFVANTASNDVSEYQIQRDGTIVLVNATEASGIPGATDEAISGGFLYVQAGLAGEVDAYRVSGSGALSLVQTVTVPDGAAAEGIAAS